MLYQDIKYGNKSFMKLVLISSAIVASVFLSGCGNNQSEELFNYGNGMINLQNVTHINGGIKLSYTKDVKNGKYVCPDAEKGGSWTNSLTSADVEIIKDSLDEVTISDCYRDIRVSSYIMFDNFTLTLFESEDVSKNNIYDIKESLNNGLVRYNSI